MTNSQNDDKYKFKNKIQKQLISVQQNRWIVLLKKKKVYFLFGEMLALSLVREKIKNLPLLHRIMLKFRISYWNVLNNQLIFLLKIFWVNFLILSICNDIAKESIETMHTCFFIGFSADFISRLFWIFMKT